MENNLKIYVVCHKKVFVPISQYLVPIQVGCSRTECIFENYIHDNMGDNISYKNPDYCELTALYWIWKNDDSPFVGVFHYRRYLAIDNRQLKQYLDYWKHFYYLEALTQQSFNDLGYTIKNIQSIENYDIIIPISSDLQYRNIENFYELYEIADLKKELDYTLKVLTDMYPEYQTAAEACKMSIKGYHCNIFIMKRAIFEEYCEWLFSILDRVYDDIKRGDLVTEKERLIGYLAEFMMGIFVCKKRSELKIKEVPAVFYNFTDGNSHSVRKYVDSAIRRVYRLFFPLGSSKEKFLFRMKDGIKRISIW